MRNRGIGSTTIIVAVIVAVAAISGGYYVLNSDEIVWSDVSSLDAKVKVTDENGTLLIEGSLKIKNVSTPDNKFRWDLTYHEKSEEKAVDKTKLIVNSELENAWMYGEGGRQGEGKWVNMSKSMPKKYSFENFREGMQKALVTKIKNNFQEWSENGEITFQEQGQTETTRIYDVKINTHLSDSLFENPTK